MLLDAGQVKEHAAGDTLFQEGDPATFTCLSLTGKLEVFTNREGRELVLRETGPGEVLGELAVLCGMPRTASVRARTHSAVLHWSADAFRRLLLRHALLSERILGQSLRVLIEKEGSLLDALGQSQGTTEP